MKKCKFVTKWKQNTKQWDWTTHREKDTRVEIQEYTTEYLIRIFKHLKIK